MPYKFVEGLTMADVAFEATGKSLEEVFESCANAMMETQVENWKSIGTKVEKSFTLTTGQLDRLLHDFLQELIFYKDAEQLIFRKYELRVEKIRDGYRLTCKAKGEEIDPKKHNMLVDVKAVSWHMFKLEQVIDGWKAVAIIDV
ncbi:MAG: archease [Candidatus Micrarchaeota archaeon]